MNEIDSLSSKQYDEYLKELDLEITSLNNNDLEKVTTLLTKINNNRNFISNKIKDGKNLSFFEEKFYYEATSKEFKNELISNPLFKDFFFKDIYNIYLTDINYRINERAYSYSNEIPLRQLYGINLTPNETLDFLKNISEDFKSEILKNNNLQQENNALKNAVKNEFKKTEDEIIKDNEDVENYIFETILSSKMIYLNLLEQNLENKTIVFDNHTFELNITFYVHITFGHYYQILKKSKRYIKKDHFKEYQFDKWKEILSKLSDKFNRGNYSIENAVVINFIQNETFYRLVLNKKKNVFISLFPLNNEKILELDLNETIQL